MKTPIFSRRNKKDLNIWVFSDPHTPMELATYNFDGLGEAINQVNNDPDFEHDIAIELGDALDINKETGQTVDEKGVLVKNKLDLLNTGRSSIYSLGGNHDASSYLDANGEDGVFKKYIDPMGENPTFSGITTRPFPVNGRYDRYFVELGNVLVVFMGDRNGGDVEGGITGADNTRPAGMVISETIRWWLDLILKNPDRPIIVNTHQGLKETHYGTRYSDSWRGQITNQNDPGTDEGQRATYMAWVDNKLNEYIFHNHLKQNTGLIDLWQSAHCHRRLGQEFEGLGELENVFGTNFLLVSNITKNLGFGDPLDSFSKHLNISGKNIRVRSYVHSSNNGLTQGFQNSFVYDLPIKSSYNPIYNRPPVNLPTTNVHSVTIDNSMANELMLNWTNENTGCLIVRKKGTQPTFTPTENVIHLIGDPVGDGEVVFIGMNSNFTDLELATGETYFYNIYSFNSGGGNLRYKGTNPHQINSIVN